MFMYARKAAFCLVLLSGAGFTAENVVAQVQITNGSIQGEVTDSAGANIPGAAVEADEIDTDTKHEAITDSGGLFSFPSLKPGRYVVKISKTGFATTIQENLTLTVGRTTTLKLALPVASANETVVVTSAPLIDVTTDSSTTTGRGDDCDNTGAGTQVRRPADPDTGGKHLAGAGWR